MPISTYNGKAIIFNNGVVDVVQGDTSLVDENKVAHIPEGNVLIDNETIIKNANQELEIPIDEDTIYIDEHGFMKAKGGSSSEGIPTKLSELINDVGFITSEAIPDVSQFITSEDLPDVSHFVTSEALEEALPKNTSDLVNDSDFLSVPLPQDSEGKYELQFDKGILKWVEVLEPGLYWKMSGTEMSLWYGLKSSAQFTKYNKGDFAGLNISKVSFDDTSTQNDMTGVDVTDMFSGITSLDIDIEFDLGNKVIDISRMFKNCTNLYSIKIGGSWPTSQIEYADEMFYGCSNLRYVQWHAGYWNFLKNKDNNMFYGCTSIFGWDGSTSAYKAEWFNDASGRSGYPSGGYFRPIPTILAKYDDEYYELEYNPIVLRDPSSGKVLASIPSDNKGWKPGSGQLVDVTLRSDSLMFEPDTVVYYDLGEDEYIHLSCTSLIDRNEDYIENTEMWISENVAERDDDNPTKAYFGDFSGVTGASSDGMFYIGSAYNQGGKWTNQSAGNDTYYLKNVKDGVTKYLGISGTGLTWDTTPTTAWELWVYANQ